MNPEEKSLLRKAAELSQENNTILRKMQRAARWAMIWGFIKFLIIVIPLVIGLILLEPYFKPIQNTLNSINDKLSTYSSYLPR